MKGAIELSGVDKRLGRRAVLRQLSLHVPECSVFALLGNNGAGKSTTIRILTGLLEADRGSVHVLGHAIGAQRMAVLREVGCLVDAPALYDNLTANEFLEIGRRLKGLARTESARVLEVAGLAGSAGERIAGFSLGMRQRLALAHAMLGNPRLLILDEPGNGLDPQGMRDIRSLLAGLPGQTGCTVFLSSHQLDEVEKIATHVAVLHGGRVLCQEAVPQLVASQAGSLALEVGDSRRAQAVLARHGYPARIADARHIDVTPIGAHDGAQLHAVLVEEGVALYQSVYRKPTLEQWFLDLTCRQEECDARDAVPA
jgi:ABC-2 type transport system ATP-binding protein